MLKITSLNTNGIRAAERKGLAQWLAQEQPDLLCVQELKAQAIDLGSGLSVLAGMPGAFHCAEKKGYSGVAIYSRHNPSDVVLGLPEQWAGVAEFNAQGRVIEMRFDTLARKFSAISAYFPSGSSAPERQEAKYRFLDIIAPYLAQLKARREVLLCGDINIAHTERDLKNWKGNLQNSGFLPEERAWMTQLLGCGWVDVYRHLHPQTEAECYTWWSNRGQAWANNVGWRIDYHLATPTLSAAARRAQVYKEQRFSDHAPLTVSYDWTL